MSFLKHFVPKTTTFQTYYTPANPYNIGFIAHFIPAVKSPFARNLPDYKGNERHSHPAREGTFASMSQKRRKIQMLKEFIFQFADKWIQHDAECV